MIEAEQQAIQGGRYALLERLGTGNTAEVYRARDRLLERDVCLGFLRESHVADPRRAERFRREARSAASLSHPNIIQIYELGTSEARRPFVAMEYVRGVTLKDRLRGSGTLAPEEAAEVATRIADALRAAHARGIFHRGLGPRKVLMSESGVVKVTGFGAASPGAANDLHALGEILYEMLTGTRPGRAGELRPPKEINSRVPESLSALTTRLLAGSTREHSVDAVTIVEELQKEVESASPPRSSRSYRAGSRLLPLLAERRRSSLPGAARGGRRRRRRARSLVAISLVTLLAVAGLGLYGSGPQGLYEELPRQIEPGSSGASPAVPETAPERVLVHTAGAESISDNSTYLDLPQTNGEPGAVISATQNWNPGTGTGTYNDHPVGVWYDAGRERWAIFNQDRAPMPEGASFNVVVWSEPAERSG